MCKAGQGNVRAELGARLGVVALGTRQEWLEEEHRSPAGVAPLAGGSGQIGG